MLLIASPSDTVVTKMVKKARSEDDPSMLDGCVRKMYYPKTPAFATYTGISPIIKLNERHSIENKI